MDPIVGVLVVLIGSGAIMVVLLNVVYVVREYERLVVFRLGRTIGSRGPGLMLLIPVVDRPVRTDDGPSRSQPWPGCAGVGPMTTRR